ncbi:MAG: PQQ-binding-like beta-propeller repeat protein [Planctomycetota bacterium]|nr:PQQ-binding-like beta-propeller repeat protein [Planctomycetota bacterium]
MWQRLISAAVLLAALASATASAEEWPSWRGPRGDGTSLETAVPLAWSATENILWKTPIPGQGHSSPVVWGDHVYVTTCQEEKQTRELLCLDAASGKVLWQKVVLTAPLERKNNLNSYASGTPATDGRRIWVTFVDKPKIWVVCYDADGKELWRQSPGEFYSVHGYCTSLLLYKDMVILNADQDAVAYIVALDQATGAERWRIDRPNRTRSYVPPVVFDAAGKKQMVLAGSKCVASYDPDTGKQYWIIDGPTEQFVASAVFSDGMFFITGGFPTLHLIGVRPDGEGNVTKTHVVWHNSDKKAASYVPSPIAAGKLFFVVSDAGLASCLEAQTGKYLWQQPLGRHHSSSPVSAAGRLYFLDDEGQMFVVKAADTYELLAKNALGEDCRGSPAISRGRLFIRGVENLYGIGAGKK